jgi:hypothetical protein
MAASMFFRYKDGWDKLSDSERYDKLVEWHKKHCQPSLFEERGRENEVEKIWDDTRHRFTGKRQEERDRREDEQRNLKQEIEKSVLHTCEKKQSIFIGLNETIRNGLMDDLWTMVSQNPYKFIIASRKMGHICRMTVSYSDSDNSNSSTKKVHLNYGTIIIRLFPKHITLRESPLKFLESPPQYTIIFEDQDGKDLVVSGSIETIVASLKERPGYIVSSYGVAEALTAIIGAFSDDGKLIIDKSVDFEGYYYHDNDIQISKINFDERHPIRTKEECILCINYLEERAKYQIWDYKGQKIDRRDLLASAIQWTIPAPFNFAIKQITNKKYWQKGFDMTGERDGGKTGLTQEMLSIHGNQSDQGADVDSIYSVPAGSMNTEAKFGKGLSKTTYPIEISEFGKIESYGRNENLVETIKTAIDGLIVRRGRDAGRYDAPFPSCSPLIFNGNPFISKKGEILKRLHVNKFSEEDRHDRDPNSAFNKFFRENGHLIKILGDWTMRYIIENKHELLLSKKYNVYEIGKIALQEFYKFGGKAEVPEWLTRWVTDTALEELDVDEESLIRSILYNHVHKTIRDNARILDRLKLDEMGTTLDERIRLCLEYELWPWIRRIRGTEPKYYINTSVLEIFTYRLPDLTLKKLAEKTRLKYVKDTEGRAKLLCTEAQLVSFIGSEGEEWLEVNASQSDLRNF